MIVPDGTTRVSGPGRMEKHRLNERRTTPSRSDQSLLEDLLELVAALDRRVPRLEREGEREIARDAQGLRRQALKRIAELERSVSVPAGRSVPRG